VLAKSSRERYESVLKNYLLPSFGKLPLREITPLSVQLYFSGMVGSPLSYASRDKIRRVLSSVMASARRYGLVMMNPVLGVRLPRNNRTCRRKQYLPPAQFQQLIMLIAEPYATMVHTAIYTGLRVSELIALRWRNIGTDTITVEERYCRGELGIPKTPASAATIPANQAVIERLHKLKTLHVRSGFRIVGHSERGQDALVGGDSPYNRTATKPFIADAIFTVINHNEFEVWQHNSRERVRMTAKA
jgi:integrase